LTEYKIYKIIQDKNYISDFDKEVKKILKKEKINSIICKMQVEKLSGGAIIAHLKPSDFEKFKIPLINP